MGVIKELIYKSLKRRKREQQRSKNFSSKGIDIKKNTVNEKNLSRKRMSPFLIYN
uniref:Uncharacterized protein n=1 Tax=Arundo donax TaxID=35708 RepID=A0A0A9GP27_ARUDO